MAWSGLERNSIKPLRITCLNLLNDNCIKANPSNYKILLSGIDASKITAGNKTVPVVNAKNF